jgi:hypothetical protein
MNAPRTALSRAWFFPTSPRSPYKLHGELQLLKQLDGQAWNLQTQLKFAALLSEYDGFSGAVSATDPAFSARDRATRAPRLLGFVHFPRKGRKGTLRFTEAGNAFLAAPTEEHTLIFQRQLAKVQFSSPLHNFGGFEQMRVKPLVLMVELLLRLKSLGKEEIALFCITLIDARQLERRIKKIERYREALKKCTVGQRKAEQREMAQKWLAHIYKDDLRAGNTKLREGGTDFLLKKYRTLRDYADASIRYLRATGLFTVTPHGQRLELMEAFVEDAKFLCKKHGADLSDYSNLDYDDYVQTYLGNPSLPALRKDSAKLQAVDLENMLGRLGKERANEALQFQRTYAAARTQQERLQVLFRLEQALRVLHVQQQSQSLRDNLVASAADVKTTFNDIANKSKEILDRPLLYEWNIWRAMVLVNDAQSVQGNFSTDVSGNPVATASGGRADIEIEYASFRLVVEVTLSRGNTQFTMEGESISRHLGQKQKETVEALDQRPVFGLFVAESLNPTVVQHLMTQARYKSQLFKGAIRIVPLSRHAFESLMDAALARRDFTHQVLLSFLACVFSPKALKLGEFDWLELIESEIQVVRNGKKA